ncbi:hypothetical protein [uncultured Bilophila sp.]|uniref:hypothetical protein n=1 Tax=uncultured Bilophila sp. TaxID=529385 RepID=UPI0026709B9F|nr:hypothetical protein [uncultured Bilophila sp.]
MQFNVAIEGNFWLCLSLWLIQDSNWKGRVLWKSFGGLATILQNWISWNEQKMREAHITRRGTRFYLLVFIEKIINRKIEHSQIFPLLGAPTASLWKKPIGSIGRNVSQSGMAGQEERLRVHGCFLSTIH